MMNEEPWLGTNCRGWYNWTQLLHPISVIFYICYNYQARHSTFLTIRDILFDFLRKKYLLCDFGTIFAFQHSFDPFSSETILNGWKFLSCKFITYYCVILCKSSNLNFKLGYLFSVIFIRHQMCQCWGFRIYYFDFPEWNLPELSGILTTRTKPDHHNSREFLINIWKLFLDVWLAIQPQASGQACS